MKGYFRQDDAGHWYLIPKEKLNRFVGLMDAFYVSSWKERWDIADTLENEFNVYRINGGIEDYEVTINE